MGSKAIDEVQRLLQLRDELTRRAARMPASHVQDAIGFEIGEIDIRLKELWSGEESGVKQVMLVRPPVTDDRRDPRPGA